MNKINKDSKMTIVEIALCIATLLRIVMKKDYAIDLVEPNLDLRFSGIIVIRDLDLKYNISYEIANADGKTQWQFCKKSVQEICSVIMLNEYTNAFDNFEKEFFV